MKVFKGRLPFSFIVELVSTNSIARAGAPAKCTKIHAEIYALLLLTFFKIYGIIIIEKKERKIKMNLTNKEKFMLMKSLDVYYKALMDEKKRIK